MIDQVIRPLMERLHRLERSQVRARVGVVMETSPLSVALGGATTPYTGLKTLRGASYTVGDRVLVLTWGADLIVLGAIV